MRRRSVPAMESWTTGAPGMTRGVEVDGSSFSDDGAFGSGALLAGPQQQALSRPSLDDGEGLSPPFFTPPLAIALELLSDSL